MDDVTRDLHRLECLSEDWAALEGFSLASKVKDFVRYYFTRFLTNIKSSFKDYTKSEIELYNHRYRTQLHQMFNNPLLSLKGILVPIPKGMIGSYQHTLEVLGEIILKVIENGQDDAAIDNLARDLSSITQFLKNPEQVHLYHPDYSRKDSDTDKRSIGNLYAKTGLTYLPADKALETLKAVQEVNDALLKAAEIFYPQILNLIKLIDELEKAHGEVTLGSQDNANVKVVLMNAAYRLSVFAVAMEHIQDMEHSFVKALEVIRKKEAAL